jgi:hypothetical protein
MPKKNIDDFPFLKQSKAHTISVIHPLNKRVSVAAFEDEPGRTLARVHHSFIKEIIEGV